MNLDHHRGIQVRNGEISEINDAIIIEDPFRILFNDCPVTDMIASRITPDNMIKQKLFPVAEKMKLYKTAGTGKFVR
jgi:hypothetical protein